MIDIDDIKKEIQKEFGSEFVAKMKHQSLVNLLMKKGLITEKEIEDSFVECAEELEEHHDIGGLAEILCEYRDQ